LQFSSGPLDDTPNPPNIENISPPNRFPRYLVSNPPPPMDRGAEARIPRAGAIPSWFLQPPSPSARDSLAHQPFPALFFFRFRTSTLPAVPPLPNLQNTPLSNQGPPPLECQRPSFCTLVNGSPGYSPPCFSLPLFEALGVPNSLRSRFLCRKTYSSPPVRSSSLRSLL